MKIFFGNKDTDYTKPNKYAFLNWHFDNSIGLNNKNNPIQSIKDNFEMGKAYISNALITLYSILDDANKGGMSDTLIFPILFDIWHGIELWLKSSIKAIYLITGTNKEIKTTHHIDDLLKTLKEELNKLNMSKTEEIALTEVTLLIGEFKRVNAHFDFARYSFDTNGNYQFYNAPIGDKKQWQKNISPTADYDNQIVPNTCVDLIALWKILWEMKNFRDFVEYLTLIIIDREQLSDENYIHYLQSSNYFEKKLDTEISVETDSLKKFMKSLRLYII